jgi:hypothetical protein
MDVSFGQVAVDPENKFPLPFQGDETLVFRDSLEQELSFVANNFFTNYYFEIIDTITEGPCAGQAVIYGKLQHKSFYYQNDSLGYSLNISHTVNHEINEDQVVLYDILLSGFTCQV